jgi:hypothetical protein
MWPLPAGPTSAEWVEEVLKTPESSRNPLALLANPSIQSTGEILGKKKPQKRANLGDLRLSSDLGSMISGGYFAGKWCTHPGSNGEPSVPKTWVHEIS